MGGGAIGIFRGNIWCWCIILKVSHHTKLTDCLFVLLLRVLVVVVFLFFWVGGGESKSQQARCKLVKKNSFVMSQITLISFFPSDSISRMGTLIQGLCTQTSQFHVFHDTESKETHTHNLKSAMMSNGWRSLNHASSYDEIFTLMTWALQGNWTILLSRRRSTNTDILTPFPFPIPSQLHSLIEILKM